ncbi:MAG: hypothetical protein ACOX6Y_06175 [Christensenellales bacterium]|jgi:hypothetical protein
MASNASDFKVYNLFYIIIEGMKGTRKYLFQHFFVFILIVWFPIGLIYFKKVNNPIEVIAFMLIIPVLTLIGALPLYLVERQYRKRKYILEKDDLERDVFERKENSSILIQENMDFGKDLGIILLIILILIMLRTLIPRQSNAEYLEYSFDAILMYYAYFFLENTKHPRFWIFLQDTLSYGFFIASVIMFYRSIYSLYLSEEFLKSLWNNIFNYLFGSGFSDHISSLSLASIGISMFLGCTIVLQWSQKKCIKIGILIHSLN